MNREYLENYKGEVQHMNTLIESLEDSILYGDYDPGLADEVSGLVLRVADKNKEIMDRIYKLESSLSRVLLILRFILLKDNFDISYRLGYSYTHVSKLMTQAITEFEKLGD